MLSLQRLALMAVPLLPQYLQTIPPFSYISIIGYDVSWRSSHDNNIDTEMDCLEKGDVI